MILILSLVYLIELFLCHRAPKLEPENRLFWEHPLLPHGALLSSPFGLRPAIFILWLALYALLASLSAVRPMDATFQIIASWLLAVFIFMARFSLVRAYRQALRAKFASTDQDLYRGILSCCKEILVYAPSEMLCRLHQIKQLSAHIKPTPIDDIVVIPSARVLTADYLPESAVWIPWSNEFQQVIFDHIATQKNHLYNIAGENQRQKASISILTSEVQSLTLQLAKQDREKARHLVVQKTSQTRGGRDRQLSRTDYAMLDRESLLELMRDHSVALNRIQLVLEQTEQVPSGGLFGVPMGEPVSPLAFKKR
jgi:hypothetical protein